MHQLWAVVFVLFGVVLLLGAIFVSPAVAASGFAIACGLCFVAAAIVVRAGSSDPLQEAMVRILTQAERIQELERERSARVMEQQPAAESERQQEIGMGGSPEPPIS